MKSRTIISAIIILLLCAVRLCFPEEANRIRDSIVPAISRDANIHEDFIAIGQAISGELGSVSVWERLTNTRKAELKASPSKAVEDKTPLIRADASDGFPLSKMVRQNLKGFEAFANLPVEEPTASVSPEASTDKPVILESPAAQSQAPSAGLASAPIAPETAPVENSIPVSNQSTKVETFLQEQSAFSDYAIPANVSYDAPTMPFNFSDPSATTVTSGFGYRDHPIDSKVKFHYGTDLGAYDGDPITAFASGTVLSAQELTGYGLTVMLDHGSGFQTLYAHCSQILVKQGDSVKCGDKIALVGHSGKVTGPHLHFEIIYNGKYLNPEFYLQ